MKRKNKKQGLKVGSSSSKRKVSEMIWSFAGEFIRFGDTLEERQNLLNAACSAWNMACNLPEVRDRSLDQYMKSYRSYNPHASDDEISAIRSDMEKLIQNKLHLFPEVRKQIVGANITRVGDKDHIDVVSARFE